MRQAPATRVRAIAAILRFRFSDYIYVEDAYGSQILGRLNRRTHCTLGLIAP